MEYYQLHTSGDLNDRSLCILDDPPEGVTIKSFYMQKGKKIGLEYPNNAVCYMREERTGIRLSSLIGSIKSYLILSSEVVDIIKDICTNEIEFLPFDLINHKKRIASKDYFIVNPIGSYDCLNIDASEIEFTSNGKPMDSEKYVIDPKKLANAPHLFRIKEFPFIYVIDSVLATKFQENKFTNILLDILEQVPSK